MMTISNELRPSRRRLRQAWNGPTGLIVIVALLATWLPIHSGATPVPTLPHVVAPQVDTPPDSAQLNSLSRAELEDEKLRQEIMQLRYENERQQGFWASLPGYVPLITALVAVAGVFITLWKQINETSRQKELDRREREAEREQRELENKRRIDEQFSAIAKSLGADTEAMRASGAVSIATFAKSGYEEYYDQAFMLVLANLKIDHTPAIASLLISSFEKIAREYIPGHDGALDFSHLTLTGVNLSGLDLSGADIGYADLRRANLTGATLKNARGYGAQCEKARFSRSDLQAARLHQATFADCQFHDARLVDVKMREANLQRAQFHRAELQGAHFEGANLQNAQFHQADLNNTFFRGATGLTPKTLKSIISAKNWEKAHFDDETRRELDELAQARNA